MAVRTRFANSDGSCRMHDQTRMMLMTSGTIEW
jgi:hypothetical protein